MHNFYGSTIISVCNKMSKSPNCRRLFKILPVTILCFGSLPSLRRLLTTCSTQHSTVRRTPSTVRTIPAHPSLLVYLGLHPTPPRPTSLASPTPPTELVSSNFHSTPPSGIPNSPPYSTPLNWYLALSTSPLASQRPTLLWHWQRNNEWKCKICTWSSLKAKCRESDIRVINPFRYCTCFVFLLSCDRPWTRATVGI